MDGFINSGKESLSWIYTISEKNIEKDHFDSLLPRGFIYASRVSDLWSSSEEFSAMDSTLEHTESSVNLGSGLTLEAKVVTKAVTYEIFRDMNFLNDQVFTTYFE